MNNWFHFDVALLLSHQAQKFYLDLEVIATIMYDSYKIIIFWHAKEPIFKYNIMIVYGWN